MNNLTERQKEIVKTSIDIISDRGIQNLTIKNLSKKIGISEPAIYRHFKNKMEILLSVLSRFENQICKNEILKDSEENSPMEQLFSIQEQVP